MVDLNILHISRTMDQGGAEKIVMQLVQEGCGQADFVCVASTGGCHVSRLEQMGAKHVEIPDLDGKQPAKMLQTYHILKRIVKNEKIQVVHAHHRMAAFYAWLLKLRFPGLRLIYTAHNVFYNRRFLTRLSLGPSAIVAVGNNVKDNLIKVFGIRPERISVICNAIDREENREDGGNELLAEFGREGKILIGTIGRLTRQKGIDVFLNAMARVVKEIPDAMGIIVGDGEDRELLQKQAEELSLQEHICFLGYQEHVIELIRQMDFVVMSSRWEGFPLTPIEVFAASKTLAASDIGGINEIVKQEYNGLLVPAEDAEAFAEAIRRLIRDVGLRRKLELGAWECYEMYYGFEAFRDGYRRQYELLMKK